MTTDPSDLTAALVNLLCAASAALVICVSLLYYAVLLSSRKWRGVVNDAEGGLRSNLEDL